MPGPRRPSPHAAGLAGWILPPARPANVWLSPLESGKHTAGLSRQEQGGGGTCPIIVVGTQRTGFPGDSKLFPRFRARELSRHPAPKIPLGAPGPCNSQRLLSAKPLDLTSDDLNHRELPGTAGCRRTWFERNFKAA